jgi:polysaccharide deacetylase 2 family uncharacterized protein YibQ
MKTFRRLVLLAALVALLIFAGRGIGRLFPGDARPETAVAPADSTAEKAWRKANPWLFDLPEYEAFREDLILPLARRHGLDPRAVRRRGGGVVEMTLPLGKPIHDYAWEVESRCAGAGIVVVEGRETATRPASVEYKLKDAKGHALSLRLVPGKGALPGAVRMAIVIVGLGAASGEDLEAWLAFPEGVTLVLPDTSPVLERLADGPAPGNSPAREVFLELPMEPASYPYVKPGPRALFIDFNRDEAEKVLGERLDAYPEAKGFATVLGDRAIENPQLMESALGVMASRSLVFLDLTSSPRSLTTSISVKTGAESFTARVQDGTSASVLQAELLRRADLAKKSGEGVWVLRHAPGLPASLAALLRREQKLFDELGLRWTPLGRLHEEP